MATRYISYLTISCHAKTTGQLFLVPTVMNSGSSYSRRATKIPELTDEEGDLQIFAGKVEPGDIK